MKKLESEERKKWSWKELGNIVMMGIKFIISDPGVTPISTATYHRVAEKPTSNFY